MNVKSITILHNRKSPITVNRAFVQVQINMLEKQARELPESIDLFFPKKKSNVNLKHIASQLKCSPKVLLEVLNRRYPGRTEFSSKAIKISWNNGLRDHVLNYFFFQINSKKEELRLIDNQLEKLDRRINKKKEIKEWKPIQVEVLELTKVLPQGPPSASNTEEENVINELTLALHQCQQRLSDGKLTWDPTPELIELCNQNNIELNKYNRPVLPAFGGENDKEVIPGIPLWMLCNESGNITTCLNPIGAVETDDVSEQAFIVKSQINKAIRENGHAPFLASKKLWNGPAHILDIFGDDGARIFAAMGSTNVRGAYTTKNRNVEVYVVNLSDKNSINRLIDEHEHVILDPSKLLTWMGDSEDAEVDGMSLCGRNAMPGKSKACQLRAMATHDSETIEHYNNVNQRYSNYILSRVHENMEIDNVKAIYNDAVQHCLNHLTEDIKIRYAKGMLVYAPWIADNVLILDVNALKGRNKTEIKDKVKANGYWKGNNLVVGMLQDIGTGNMSMSWQAIMYFMWNLPNDFPTTWNWKGQEHKMAGRFGWGPAQMRASMLLNNSIEEFEKGLVDDTMSKIFDNILMDEIMRGENITEQLTMALWNNIVIRNEVGTWVMNFLRRNKYLFQTVGMSKINQILPEKKYILDMNYLPDEKSKVDIELHDGTKHQAIVAFLKDDKFWKTMGVDELPLVMFRHPVSDFRVIDVILAKNPNVHGWSDLAPGMWLNSRVTKEVFTGDTDGDTCGYFPLWCPTANNNEGGYILDYTQEDYCCLYSVVKQSVDMKEKPTNVERYMQNVKTNPIKPFLGEAEQVMAQSGALVGSAALLQSQVLRLYSHFLNDSLKVVNEENNQDLINLVETILHPLYLEVAAILELSISLQKKDVSSAICEALNKATFLNDNADPYLFRRLIKAIVVGSNSDDEQSEKDTSAALQKGEIESFSTNWGNAVCELIRNLMNEFGVVVKNDDGTFSPVDYAYADRHSRFADQMKDEDPELCYGTYENLNWGILNSSNLHDALARWSHVFNGIAKKVKERVIRLTENKLVNGNKIRMTNANRCVGNESWQYLTSGYAITDLEKTTLADMYAKKIMWSNLGLKVKWNRRLENNTQNSDLAVDCFEFGCKTYYPATSFFAWIVGRYLGGDPVTSERFYKGIKWLFNEASSKTFGIQAARDCADKWINQMIQVMQESQEYTNAEWTLFNMTEETYNQFFVILRDAATILLHLGSQDFFFDPNERQEFIAFIATQKLHTDSLNILSLMQLINIDWIPSENDFRKVLQCIKNLRSNMRDEKKIWREETNKIKDSLSHELMIECWKVAYNKTLLEDILSRSWICEQERTRALEAHVQYYFAAWGFDAMRDFGISKSSVIGKGKENPRIPILINEDKWNWDVNWNDLKPIPLSDVSNEEYPLCFEIQGRYEQVNRNMHATALLNKEKEVVGVVCESLAIMRILLGFDEVRILKNGMVKKDANPKASFAPISKWWQDKLDGNWIRYNCRLRARNLDANYYVAQVMSDMKLPEATLKGWQPNPKSYQVIRYESGSVKCLKRNK